MHLVLAWRKSTYSGNAENMCVEVAGGDRVHARDSKAADGPRLVFGRTEWQRFVDRCHS